MLPAHPPPRVLLDTSRTIGPCWSPAQTLQTASGGDAGMIPNQSVPRRMNTNHLYHLPAESGPDCFFPRHEGKIMPSTFFHFSQETPIIAYFAMIEVRTHQ